MKYLLILLLLLGGCTTLGTRTMMDEGEKICYNDFGLDYIKIKEDNKYRWFIMYTCLNGNKYGKGVY